MKLKYVIILFGMGAALHAQNQIVNPALNTYSSDMYYDEMARDWKNNQPTQAANRYVEVNPQYAQQPTGNIQHAQHATTAPQYAYNNRQPVANQQYASQVNAPQYTAPQTVASQYTEQPASYGQYSAQQNIPQYAAQTAVTPQYNNAPATVAPQYANVQPAVAQSQYVSQTAYPSQYGAQPQQPVAVQQRYEPVPANPYYEHQPVASQQYVPQATAYQYNMPVMPQQYANQPVVMPQQNGYVTAAQNTVQQMPVQQYTPQMLSNIPSDYVESLAYDKMPVYGEVGSEANGSRMNASEMYNVTFKDTPNDKNNSRLSGIPNLVYFPEGFTMSLPDNKYRIVRQNGKYVFFYKDSPDEAANFEVYVTDFDLQKSLPQKGHFLVSKNGNLGLYAVCSVNERSNSKNIIGFRLFYTLPVGDNKYITARSALFNNYEQSKQYVKDVVNLNYGNTYYANR